MSLFSFQTLAHQDTGFRDEAEHNLTQLSLLEVFVSSLPSGLPAETPAGRAICIGPGEGGVATLFLAYANPSLGLEYRRRCVGLTIDRAPELGKPLRFRYLGTAPFDNTQSPAQTGQSNPGGINAAVTELPPIYGDPAFLKDADESDPETQGFLTLDAAESTGNIIVGGFMPGQALLIRPHLPEDL